MINGINSYPNYNYTNTFNNNTSNTKSSNVINNNSNLVSDKSQAVDKILDYGVDKDGFFTSDFNEAAGLPKDYKIYAKDIENFVNIQTKSLLSSYINIDVAKSIGNAYKVFSQLLNNELNNKINFTKEDLVKIPQGFEFNQNTLKINKKYNLSDKEYKDFISSYKNYSPTSNNIKMMTFFSLDNKSDIFKYSLINPTPYSNNDRTITKNGIFMAFFTGFQAKNYFIEGQTSILGKMQGLNKTMSQSEIDNLNKFISENSMNFKGSIFELFDLLNSDMSIDDFKQKILEQKENLNNPTAKFEFNPKIFGLDGSISKKDMQEFNNFMKSNALKDPNKIEKSSLKNLGKDYNSWDIKDEDIKLMTFYSYSQMFHLGLDITKKASNFRKEFNNLMQEDLTLDEFKAKYLDFKQRHDEFVKEFEVAMGDKMLLANNSDISIQDKEKPFTPIQGESKNKETYKDDSTRNELVKKLLEGKFSTSEELELLFGMKFNDDDTKEVNQFLSQNIPSKIVDIKV